ncbi:DUF6098 family protein [Streptomyces sp. NPDC044780]|uniref:DUF6098 family protein n=1 Tax=unclassified Streptomyces TaxID=2593676 RepID=UPI0033E32BB5
MPGQTLPTYTALHQLVELIEEGPPVFVRWSRGPQADLGEGSPVSRDGLTGTKMPGLSANPLVFEEWAKDLPTALWVARRLCDYIHLREQDQGPDDVHPWVLKGEEIGRGPDNEPLVRDVRPVAWIADSVIAEAEEVVARQRGAWGPLHRPTRYTHGEDDG